MELSLLKRQSESCLIKAGLRASPLSMAQGQEISALLPGVQFQMTAIETIGDKDQTTSLRSLDKTDFFTRELDRMLLEGAVDLCIHSAKDLPDPIPEGIEIAAITQGLDPGDSLVILDELPSTPLIATSSERREEAVRMLYPDARFVDIRGTIGKRLEYLEKGEVDGVVIAEAALLRLGLHNLKRIRLPGETTPYQGKLALTVREGDEKTRRLVSSLDTRKKVLWLGLRKPRSLVDTVYTHLPLIVCKREAGACPSIKACTHLLVTSQTTVEMLEGDFSHLVGIAVGKKTADAMRKAGLDASLVADDECSEGVIALLEGLDLSKSSIFWPHSTGSRPLIREYLKKRGVTCVEWPLYRTEFQAPQELPSFDAVMFTSPSTVDAFVHFFGTLPEREKILCQGAPTRERVVDRTPIQKSGIRQEGGKNKFSAKPTPSKTDF